MILLSSNIAMLIYINYSEKVFSYNNFFFINVFRCIYITLLSLQLIARLFAILDDLRKDLWWLENNASYKINKNDNIHKNEVQHISSHNIKIFYYPFESLYKANKKIFFGAFLCLALGAQPPPLPPIFFDFF